MKIRDFTDPATLLLQCRVVPLAETRDLEENTVLGLHGQGNICAITIEHTFQRAVAPQFTDEQVTA